MTWLAMSWLPMSWLYEEPWPILLVGVALEAVLLVMFVQSRHLAVLVTMAGVLLLTVVLLAVEHFVVTPVEEVQGVIYATAAALDANESQAVLARISPRATHVRAVVERRMPRMEITKARIIGSLKISINELTIPPSATASFRGMVNGLAGADRHHVTHFGRFTITLRREDDRWLISDYEEQR